jgi:hypothetical protein
MTSTLSYLGSKFLYLTSANRQSGNINGCLLTFPNRLFYSNNNQKTILKVSLQTLIINQSWYNVSSRCNYFKLNGNDVHITEGNPTVYDLLNYFNTTLSSTYTVTYDVITNKFTFTSLNPTNTIQPITSGHLFGLVNGTTVTGTFTSTMPINVQYENSIYLNADFAISSAGMDNINNTQMSVSSIIAHIPIVVAPGDDIIYESFKNTNESAELSVNGQGLDSATFSITTNRGYVLNLDYDYTFTLRFESFQAN